LVRDGNDHLGRINFTATSCTCRGPRCRGFRTTS
jgi:hypothetical protein